MNLYLEDIRLLEIDTKKILFPRASEHVAGMVAMIRTLEEKSYAYLTSDGIYFDTARFQNYGALGGIDTTTLQEGARVAANPEKHNPSDFALWKFNKKMGWDSPWGKGFPGWHMECSAMINAILGKQIDIHTGGIEHISVHHNNEIAQSEAATGKKPLARFWLHRAHIQMDNQKLAKSSGNVAYLSDLTDRGIHPLSLRYWFLTSHYRQPSNFTWQALEAAQTAHVRLHERMQSLSPEPESNPPSSFKTSFIERMNDDMDTPGALALLWETVKDSKFTPAEIKAAISFADKALGLRLTNPDENLMKLLKPETQVVDIAAVSDEVRALLEARQKARDEKDWTKADSIRVDLLSQGFSVRDSADGPVLEKTKQ
jgi:cysteinyl-tRNA synthetase